jgi:hypothetical protein
LSRTNQISNLAPGYFAGVSEALGPRLPSEDAVQAQVKLNRLLDELWEQNPALAFNIMAPSGDFVRSFARSIVAVNEKKIPAQFMRTFTAWNGPRHTLPDEARIATQVLLNAAIDGDEDAADVGIEFLVFLSMRANESIDKLTWLQAIYEDETLDVPFGLLEKASTRTKELTHWFSQIFARVMPANLDRAVSILIEMMKVEDYDVAEAAAGLFSTVASVRPQELMDGIGTLMLSAARTTTSYLGNIRSCLCRKT